MSTESAGLLLGLDIPASAARGADPAAEACHAEELGFDFVSASDHPSGAAPSFETWTMLTWIAAATTRIQIATRVLGVPYRPPAMVAKMAETLHRLSGGRLILGLGGGYSDEEFRAFGLRVPTPGEKVDGLAEAIQIMRGLWAEPEFTFAGEHYRTEAAPMEPKPVSPIPIWLGTFGPRALAVTGRLADGWIPSMSFAPPDQAVQMRARIMAAAAEAGRDPAALVCAYNITVRVDSQAPSSAATLTGAPDQIADRLRDLTGLGFTAFNFMPTGPDRHHQAELLAREVIPRLR